MIDDTTLMFRVAPLLLVAGTTLMATIVVLGNLTDPRSNMQFVERIMSMDTTYRSPRLMWRAITSKVRGRCGLICRTRIATNAAPRAPPSTALLNIRR